MIAGLDQPTNLLLSAGAILVVGLGAILAVWGRRDRFSSQRGVVGFIKEFAPLLACSALVFACSAVVLAAFILRVNQGTDVSLSLLPGFTASLLEDIFFFIAVGVVIFTVQRREFERSRNIDDRLDTLFNGKRLTSEELSALKGQIRAIGCDFRKNDTLINVAAYNTDHNCVLLDITRRWSVRSYFRDESASYDWKISIIPDDISGLAPLLEIFPSQQRTYHRKKGRSWVSEVVELHPIIVQSTPEPYYQPFRVERIEPGTIWEFRLRYRAWQRLRTADGQHDFWQFKAEKHWDIWSVRIVNSLPNSLRIDLVSEERKTVELGPGAEQNDSFELTNLSPGTTVQAKFQVLPGVLETKPLS